MLSRSNIEIMALKQQLTELEIALRETPMPTRIHLIQGETAALTLNFLYY